MHHFSKQNSQKISFTQQHENKEKYQDLITMKTSSNLIYLNGNGVEARGLEKDQDQILTNFLWRPSTSISFAFSFTSSGISVVWDTKIVFISMRVRGGVYKWFFYRNQPATPQTENTSRAIIPFLWNVVFPPEMKNMTVFHGKWANQMCPKSF